MTRLPGAAIPHPAPRSDCGVDPLRGTEPFVQGVSRPRSALSRTIPQSERVRETFFLQIATFGTIPHPAPLRGGPADCGVPCPSTIERSRCNPEVGDA
jgi:hypothetical protein